MRSEFCPLAFNNWLAACRCVLSIRTWSLFLLFVVFAISKTLKLENILIESQPKPNHTKMNDFQKIEKIGEGLLLYFGCASLAVFLF